MSSPKYGISPIKFPCKDCLKRKTGCHTTCEDYLKASKINEVHREERLKNSIDADNLYIATGLGIKRMKRTNSQNIGLYKDYKK